MADALKRDKKGRLVKGTPPGPGRPVGSVSIMTEIKRRFLANPHEFHEYVDGVLQDKMLRREIVQQLDGKPVQPIAGVEGQPLVIQVTKYGDSQPPIPTP